jgi:twitching motility protein PilT
MRDFGGAAASALRARLPTLAQILARAVEAKASDVHIHAGAPLQMRLGGALRELRTGVLDAQAVEFILKDALGEADRATLNEQFDFDAALVLPEVGRFRASFYRQQRGWDAVFRPIAAEPPTLEQLGLPPVLRKLTGYHQGLVLVTGPAGCGKSSTLAALVSLLNAERHDHIITVEDPIEFVHTPRGCIVNQRQAGKHTRSFANALRAALREDPDIIVIGELRDLETIQLAITAAETGHLVLGTLHTNNAVRTINRVLDVFPPKQQSQVRAMVSESLRAVVSQRLLPAADGQRRVPALEVLFVKPSVSNLIREEKTFQIRSVMQTGRAEGMTLLDDSLLELVKAGTVTREVARRVAEDPRRFQ